MHTSLNFIILIVLSIFVVSCDHNENSKTVKNDTNKNGITRSKSDTIKISPEGPKTYKLKVGDLISYSYLQYGSVGNHSEYSLKSKDILSLKDEKYDLIDPSKSDMPGGDETIVTLVFEAKKTGTCTLNIRDLFRGDLERELNFEIIVK